MVQMIVIGTDTHKRTHALAAVDEGTGRIRGNREIKADEAGHLAALKGARGLDEVRVWAIEDCRSVSRRLEEALIAAGERVVRVAPHRMGGSRRGEREPGKSDEIDSLAIARAVVKDGVECFPAAFLDEQAMEIRLIADHRHDLVVERTRMQNRLRWHLVTLAPELEASLRRGALSDALAILIAAHRPALLAETGCGALTAAILIGRTAGAERFATDASFAQQTGTAPLKCSSGQRQQHRLNRGGDRQLNHALHIIAITRTQHDPTNRAHPPPKPHAVRPSIPDPALDRGSVHR